MSRKGRAPGSPHSAPTESAHRPLAPLIENVAESATACMVTMLQGNLFAMTVGHWIIASRTGVLSGAIATLALLAAGKGRRWAVAVVLGFVTLGVDLLSHPSNFGGVATEAIVTGAAASALSLAVGRALAWRRARRASRTSDASHAVMSGS